jgi:hypothetical protein
MNKKPENTGEIQGKRDKKGRFIKGISGNIDGKPLGSISLTAMIKKKLQLLSPDGKRQAIEVLADNIIQDGLDSSDNMRKLIWNYLDGLPKQGIDITHQIKNKLTKEQVDELFKQRR